MNKSLVMPDPILSLSGSLEGVVATHPESQLLSPRVWRYA
jgi:hypothetical protein